jgi:hypothetical protein
MGKLMAALAVGMALTGGSVASAQNSEDGLTVTLHVSNYADMSPKELAAAEAYATAIYRAAGIQTVWIDTAWTAGETRLPRLRVVILSPEMTAKKCKAAQFGASVMGTAIDGATDGSGRIAYIFAGRVEHVAISNHIPIERGLGHAMAHEIGHLLIGVNGLMPPEWNPDERQVQTLTSSQVQTIRSRFQATVS